MFHDHHLGSDTKRQDREAKSYLFHLERQNKKDQQQKDEETKDALIDHYLKAFGVVPSSQQRFFMDPVRLRELLTKKAIEKTQDNAARRLQNWWTCKVNYKKFMVMLRNTIRCVKMLQRKWRRHLGWYLLPKRHMALKRKNTEFIQPFLKGYIARRATLKAKADYQAE